LKILDRIRGELQDICMVETPPRKEGSILHMILAPRKGAASAAARPAETPKARG